MSGFYHKLKCFYFNSYLLAGNMPVKNSQGRNLDLLLVRLDGESFNVHLLCLQKSLG